MVSNKLQIAVAYKAVHLFMETNVYTECCMYQESNKVAAEQH